MRSPCTAARLIRSISSSSFAIKPKQESLSSRLKSPKGIRIQPTPKRKRFDPNSFPTSVRAGVEIDYAKKLTAQEKDWLASFNEAEYGANPDHLSDITGNPVSMFDRRKAWREIQRVKRNAAVKLDFRADNSWIVLCSPSIEIRDDSLIEVIDRFSELECIVVTHLKADILDKYRNEFEGMNGKAQDA